MRAARPRTSYAGLPVVPPGDIDGFLSLIGAPDPETGCREWLGARFAGGYGLWREGDRPLGAHRVALALALGESTPGDTWTLHHCDNPPCCEESHLYLGDNDQNVLDRVTHGRQRRGQEHHAAVLTDEQVVDYRHRYAAGENGPDMAREAGMHESGFSAMLSGRTWPRLPGAVKNAKVHGQVRGEKAGLAKLTAEQVLEAREFYLPGDVSLSALATRYGVEKSAMRQAITGKTWAHLPGALPAGTVGRRGARGTEGGNTSLTEATVREIRRRAAEGERQASIAREMGVAQTQVSRIVRRERWAHLD